jgi:hypothetical protein
MAGVSLLGGVFATGILGTGRRVLLIPIVLIILTVSSASFIYPSQLNDFLSPLRYLAHSLGLIAIVAGCRCYGAP